MLPILQLAAVRGYPDRLYRLNTAPLGTVLNTVLGLLLPLMPGALSSKLNLMREKGMMREVLVDILHGGEEVRISTLLCRETGDLQDKCLCIVPFAHSSLLVPLVSLTLSLSLSQAIPDFFGGPMSHDQFYPKDGFGVGQDFEALGDGVLMFDWTGMVKRQADMKKEWMDKNGKVEN